MALTRAVARVNGLKVLAEFRTGNRLLEDDDGALYVGWPGGETHRVKPEKPMGLLPVLERDRESVPADLLAKLPLTELLLLALTWNSHEWPRLAMRWLSPADLEDVRIHRAVGEIASSRERPQQLQHAARRLLKAADLPRRPPLRQ